jgi:hypothetical protein
VGIVLLLFDTIFCTVAYATARILLPFVTFGKVRVDAAVNGEAGFNWLGFKRLPDGVMLFDSVLAGWFGVFFWVFLLVGILALLR